jgi:hypothetical protein
VSTPAKEPGSTDRKQRRGRGKERESRGEQRRAEESRGEQRIG